MPKLKDQVSVRIAPEWRKTLRAIEERHRIPAPEFIRGLVSAGLEFYRTHGWFAFPIEVKPESDYVQAITKKHRHKKNADKSSLAQPQLPEKQPKRSAE